MTAQNVAFYVKAVVTWKESTKSKGYFHYGDVKKENACVKLVGNNILITDDRGDVYNKRVTGKYIAITGKEVTEKTYNKYVKNILAAKYQRETEAKAQRDKELAEQIAEIDRVKMLLQSALTQEQSTKWADPENNQGNAHQRRTRWMNRANRLLGSNKTNKMWIGSVLRDIVLKVN